MVAIIATGRVKYLGQLTPELVKQENTALAQLPFVEAAYLDESLMVVTLVVEADSAVHAAEALDRLPFVEAGMLVLQYAVVSSLLPPARRDR
jgi:hypothetical protein